VVKNTQSDCWNLSGGKMGTNEIMHHPVSIESGLESGFLLGIGIGLAPKTSHASSEGTVEGFQMVGVNVWGINMLRGVRVFRLRGLIFGSFAASLVSLRAFILETHLQARFECFFGRPILPVLTTSWQISNRILP